MTRTRNKKSKKKKNPIRQIRKRFLPKKEKEEEIISLNESESNSHSEAEEKENKKINVRQKRRKRRNSMKDKDKTISLLNKKKSKSKSKSKSKEKKIITNKKFKRKEPEEIYEELEESEDEEENEDIEEQNINKVNKSISLNDDKNKRKSKKKENIEKININDFKEDPSITCKNHNIIEDCCIECNEKNIYRAIKTNDKVLYNNCLKEKNKISNILEYKLHMLRDMNPLQYIIKSKNKALLTEFINYYSKHKKENRVVIPKTKLEKLASGKSDYYNRRYHSRKIGISRGNKLGNNAFIISEPNEDFDDQKNFGNYEDIENIFFNEDDEFNFFKTFAKNQDLDDDDIDNLLEENIIKGNIDIVEYLMSIFINRNYYGYNQLHLMVTNQKPGGEKNIDIKNKMSLNKSNRNYITPVKFACINPNEKILLKLIENGAELNIQDKLGRKPISFAAVCKSSGPLKLLLENNCNINDRDNAGYTPLILACKRGRYENVKIILEQGADPKQKIKGGKYNGIHFACMEDSENNLKIVKLLLDTCPELINMNGIGRKSPLHFAVLHNCPKIVELLVKSGANLDKKDSYWRTPLILACKYGYSQLAEYLIKCGAKINKCDNSNNSPLHYACAFGNFQCVKVLLENGADINCLNMWKNLPIEIALLKNHLGIVNYLVNSNIFSVNTPFGNGNTFLLYYLSDIQESTFEKIKYLIEKKKGSAQLFNNNKMNAFHFLAYFDYSNYINEFLTLKEIRQLTPKKHKDIYHPKYMHVLQQYVSFLKNNGCEVDLRNNIGVTPLFFALENKNFELGKILIENYSKEINIKNIDNNGFNIFDYCCLSEECYEFFNTMFKIYDKNLDKQFLNSYTRYGRNALLNLCRDFALHIYEKFYDIKKNIAIDFVRKNPNVENDNDNENKYFIPKKYFKTIFEKSVKELNDLVSKKFYPLIEILINKGCDINCCTQEKKFKNKNKKYEYYSYFNNYGKIYPIMYLVSYPESESLIKLIKKYKIDINCTDLKNQNLLMYLLEVQSQIKNIDKNNYQKIFKFLINNCNNLTCKTSENKNLFVSEIEKRNKDDALIIYKKLGNKIDINYPYYNNYLTLFGQALLDSDEELIEFYLNNFKNINLNQIDYKYNRNVLHYICMDNSPKNDMNFHKYEKYINLGVSLTQKDIFGRNPLFYLFISKENEIKKKEDPISSLSYLLDSYYNLNKNKNKNELDINSKDICGNSLIFYAVKSNAAFCVSNLLSKGAEIKGIKNLENNSIFSYALLSNSTSIQELYNEVNDIRVFEDKLYKINNDPIDNELNKAEEQIKNNRKDENKERSKKIIDEYCAEELFNDNYEKKEKVPEKEIDENLEKLFKENDEGINLFSNTKIKKNDISNNSESIEEEEESKEDTFDFKESTESKDDEGNSDMSISEDKNEESDWNSFLEDSEEDNDDEDDDDEDNGKKGKSKNKKNSGKSIKLDKIEEIYSFYYFNELEEIISEYINKNLGNNHHHYDNNYIPAEKYNFNSNNFPQIKSKKYKLYISQEESDSEKKEEEEAKGNKIISESLFKYCIEKNYQNIIYYILNKGYEEHHAISDALSSGNYEIALILLERFSSISLNKLKTKNEKGQNLLHILCNNKINNNIEKNKNIIQKIFDILIDKVKLNKNEFDKNMHTPLYYIVENNNFKFFDYLLPDKSKKSEYKLFLQRDKNDDNNLSPLILLEKKILDKSYTEKDISHFLYILDLIIEEIKTGDIKYILKYMIKNVDNLDFVSKQKSSIIKEEDPNNIKALDILKILAENKACDINCDIDEKGNNVFLKSAIKNNYDMFKLMINFASLLDIKINYNKVNKEGKSLIHYIVCPHPLYSYQNVHFLKAALKSGFNPNLKDKEGLTPLDYAKEYNYKDMINILKKHKALESKQKKEKFMEIEADEIGGFNNVKNINYDYQKVSQKYYKEIISPFILLNKPLQDPTKSLVTNDCELIVDNYRVYQDNDGILYNVNLSKVDIKKNLYSKYVFYHIQLLKNEKRNMYNLITRWGEFGESGQYQNTPFTNIEEAIKEFNKIFWTKTKNNWEQIKNNFDLFEKKQNKYEILNLTNKRPEINDIIDYFNEELKNIKIKIPKDFNNNNILNNNTREFLLNLIQGTFSEKIRRKKSYDSDDNDKNTIYKVLYFSKESLDKGIKILNELALLNDRLDELKENLENQKISEKKLLDENSPYSKNKKEYHEVSQKILNLTNTYYEIIPDQNENNFSIRPLDNATKIREEMKKILSYIYIEDSLKLFLSSLYYCNKIDPISYIYKSINKKIIPLNLDLNDKNNKDKYMVKILLNYIRLYKSSRKVITNIFEIIDNNKNELGNDINKRILLFHGTKAENVLGILNKGLLIAPIEAESSGNKYGNGIYLSDNFYKSLDYCSGNKLYVLVVDTYLDNVFKISEKNLFKDVKTLKKNKFNCLINDTKVHITEDRIYFVNGTSVPIYLTEEETKKNNNNYYYDYKSEYVIYDSKLVNVKYIIELEY